MTQNQISTSALVLAALAVVVAAVWCIVENHREQTRERRERQQAQRRQTSSQRRQIKQLSTEVADLRQQLAEFDLAYRRVIYLLGEQNDSVASLKRQLKQLPAVRHRAIETSATTTELPRIESGRRVLASAVVGEISMSSVPTTLRERQATTVRTGTRRKPRS